MTRIFRSAEGQAQLDALYRRFLDHWPVPRDELRLATDQGETFVIGSGPKDAPALLLLHGSAFNSVAWMGDVVAWSRHFRVYAVDVIGEPGWSAPTRPPLASDAYKLWLDDVMRDLGLARASFVGMSLGGWLALDYATRRPDRMEKLALIAPGGVGRNRNVALWALPLIMTGKWGRRRLVEKIAGPAPIDPSPELQAVMELQSLIFREFRPRIEPLPIMTDAALARLTMPVMALLGGKDVFIDSAGARARLERQAPHAEILWLADAPHAILGQTQSILTFLLKA
jgi:pimeloyl-ACP methyl ester carboxylesterase